MSLLRRIMFGALGGLGQGLMNRAEEQRQLRGLAAKAAYDQAHQQREHDWRERMANSAASDAWNMHRDRLESAETIAFDREQAAGKRHDALHELATQTKEFEGRRLAIQEAMQKASLDPESPQNVLAKLRQEGAVLDKEIAKKRLDMLTMQMEQLREQSGAETAAEVDPLTWEQAMKASEALKDDENFWKRDELTGQRKVFNAPRARAVQQASALAGKLTWTIKYSPDQLVDLAMKKKQNLFMLRDRLEYQLFDVPRREDLKSEMPYSSGQTYYDMWARNAKARFGSGIDVREPKEMNMWEGVDMTSLGSGIDVREPKEMNMWEGVDMTSLGSSMPQVSSAGQSAL